MQPATIQQQSAVFFMPPREEMLLNIPAPATQSCSPAGAQSDFSRDTAAFD